MKFIKLFTVLRALQLLSLGNLFRLFSAWYRHGVNLMLLLSFTAAWNPAKRMVVEGDNDLSFHEMYVQSMILAQVFSKKLNVHNETRIAFICRNDTRFIQALFASSRLGASCFLINAEMSAVQLENILAAHSFDVVVGGTEQQVSTNSTCIHINEFQHMIEGYDLSRTPELPRRTSGPVILLTGGTTGNPKEAHHQPSLFSYLAPLLAIVTNLKLAERKIAYVATPLYHGYGFSILLVFLALGKPVVLSAKFTAEESVQLIEKYEVDMMNAVPLMIDKMLALSSSDLRTLRCIACGGAELNANLVQRVQSQLGSVLYNLYGTSETGLNLIATPEDLRNIPVTVGRCIEAMSIEIRCEKGLALARGEIGQLWICNEWSMKNAKQQWIATGDLSFQDTKGLFYLVGRLDEMIVSAGENVYPIDIERLLLEHPAVQDAAVVGISDELFGERLKAYVVSVEGSDLSEEMLRDWLSVHAARYQIPKELILTNQIPYTTLGKKNRKELINR